MNNDIFFLAIPSNFKEFSKITKLKILFFENEPNYIADDK